jgi:cardiolipin synthase
MSRGDAPESDSTAAALAAAALATPPATPQPLRPRCVSVSGNELTLFVESAPLIAAMVEDIHKAQTRVWLETYIFHDDDCGRAVRDALIDRCRAGVEVRVLYDAIGSQKTPWSFFRPLIEARATVHEFHSFWEALWRFSPLRILNRRDHRKLLVIDDRVGYFGGMNIVDTASAGAVRQAEHVPTSAGWRDVHVRLEGPAQPDLAESLDRSWRRAHGEKIPRRPGAYRRAILAREPESIQFFDSGPGRRHMRAYVLFHRLIRMARRRLTLSMAYFLPVGRVLKALLRAPRRGVLVRVVVPGESDVPLVQHATRHLYSWLLRRRIRIFERQMNMLHSKVMIVDRKWSVVGSCNLDARSLSINLEFLGVIHSPALAKALEEIVAHEIAHSTRITLHTYRERSLWRRLVNRLAWMLRWWL